MFQSQNLEKVAKCVSISPSLIPLLSVFLALWSNLCSWIHPYDYFSMVQCARNTHTHTCTIKLRKKLFHYIANATKEENKGSMWMLWGETKSSSALNQNISQFCYFFNIQFRILTFRRLVIILLTFSLSWDSQVGEGRDKVWEKSLRFTDGRLIIFDTRKWAKTIVQWKLLSKHPQSPLCCLCKFIDWDLPWEKKDFKNMNQTEDGPMKDDVHTCIFPSADLSQPGSRPSAPPPATPPHLPLGMQ